jgi:putative flippase GtrA
MVSTPSAMATLSRWPTFISVGAMGLGVQLVTLVTLTEALGLDYLAATALAVEVAILHNFEWHERWTWSDRSDRGGRWRRLAWFNLVSGTLSITGNVGFTGLYATTLEIHYLPANLMAIASCSLVNFLANDRFVFRQAAPTDLAIGAPEASASPRRCSSISCVR